MNNNREISKGAAELVAGIVASCVMNEFSTRVISPQTKEKSDGAQSQQPGSSEHGAGALLKKLGAASLMTMPRNE